MEKILIIGANGFLGYKLVQLFKQQYTTYAGDITLNLLTQENAVQIDITDKIQLESIFMKIKPDLTILPAAMTNVDQCELQPELAYKINTQGPQNVVDCVHQIHGRFIFLSTDFVFDGTTGNYHENDLPNPINVYGQSKLDAERYILASDVPSLILRTSVLFGWPQTTQRDNFFSWAYNQLSHNQPVKIVKDQINSPTLVDDLAHCIFQLRNFSQSGLYHACGSERISRYDFIRKLISIFGFNIDLLEEAPHIVQKARRPYDCSLKNEKIQEQFKFRFKNITESFIHLKKS